MNKFTILFILIGFLSLASANLFSPLLRNLVKPRVFPSQSSFEEESIVTKYFTQKLDHFNQNDERTFLQRYMEDCTNHEPNGPIIMFVGSANQAYAPAYTFDKAMREIAEMHNGCLIYPELRYTGESTPFKNFTLENWQYFTVDQILEDLAFFINELKSRETHFKKSKIVLIGVTGSATYVSWFRVKYPELSVGAWASSGPVEVKPDAYEENIILGNIYKKYGGQQCYDKIHNGFRAIENDLKQGNMTRINKNFNICPEFNPMNKKDAQHLVSTFSSEFNPFIFFKPQEDIEEMCQKMNEEDDDIDALGKVIVFEPIGDCLNLTYNQFIYYLQEEIASAESFVRAVNYLGCYQHVWFSSSEAENQPFGTIVDFNYFVDACRDTFRDPTITKESIENNAQILNKKYGGLKGNYTNLYSTQGELDPSRFFGLHKIEDSLSHVEIIAGATVGSDIHPSFITDPTKTAILGAKYYISKWLNQ